MTDQTPTRFDGYNPSDAQSSGVSPTVASDGVQAHQAPVKSGRDIDELKVLVKDYEQSKTLSSGDFTKLLAHETNLSVTTLQYKEILETALVQHALKLDPNLSKLISEKDVENITCNAACFVSNDYLAGFPGFVVFDLRLLNSDQRRAICTVYLEHYKSMEQAFTLEDIEKMAASLDAYFTGHIRRANFNNLIFFPIKNFFEDILKDLILIP